MPSKKQLLITIPQSCDEPWDQMSPTEKGRYCSSCKKDVIDFKDWSDQAIHRYFSLNSQHVCGQFRQSQLDRPLQPPVSPKTGFNQFFLGIGLTLIFFEGPGAFARARPPYAFCQPADTSHNASGNARSFRGRVLDEKGEAMIGAIIQLSQNKAVIAGAQTNENGEFEIKSLEKGRFSISISYIGYLPYVSDTLVLNDKPDAFNISLKPNPQMNQVIVRGYTVPLIDKYVPGKADTVNSVKARKR
jgi:hypothetical protein